MGKNRTSTRLFETALACILFFAVFPPSLLTTIPTVGAWVKALSIVVFGVSLSAYLIGRTTVSKPFLLLIAWRVALLFSTILNEGDLAQWGSSTASVIGAFMLISIYCQRGIPGLRIVVDALLLLLGFYLAWNLTVVVSAWQGGMPVLDTNFNPGYPLGIRTRISDSAFVALALAIVSDTLKPSRNYFRTATVLAIVLPQLYILQVATAWVGLGVFLLTLLLFRNWPIRRTVTFGKITLVGTVVSLLITAMVNNQALLAFVAKLLGKSATLTGRTEIWHAAWPFISEAPIIGHGINTQFGAFVPALDGSLWQAHNQHLQLLYDGGLLGLLLFTWFLFACGAGAPAHKELDPKPEAYAAFLAIYTAFSAMMVSEIFTYNMGIFMVVPFIYYFLRECQTAEVVAHDLALKSTQLRLGSGSQVKMPKHSPTEL